jgi:hypothetical protein
MLCRPQAMKLSTFWCVITAPFGKPVEPLVNMMYAPSEPVISEEPLISPACEATSRKFTSLSACAPVMERALSSVGSSTRISAGMQRSRIRTQRSGGLDGSMFA